MINRAAILIGAAGAAPEPGQPVIGERGVLNRPWIRAMLAAVDRHVAVAGSAVIAITTRDVQRYLDNLPIRAATDVDNDTGDRHGIAGYLKDPVVAKTIYDALVAD